MTYERGIKNKATISIDFSMKTFPCLSASLKGSIRILRRCWRASRIGNECLRSFLVLTRMFIVSPHLVYMIKTSSYNIEKSDDPLALPYAIRQKLDPTKQIVIWPSLNLLWHAIIPSFLLIWTWLKMSIIANKINNTSVSGIRIWICVICRPAGLYLEW